MNRNDIRPCAPELSPRTGGDAMARARNTARRLGIWGSSQQMGNRWPVGCIALEITQRCNLNCTACYLSENAEFIKDPPLEEIFSRIDQIYRYYGRKTNVQVTGGEPTLRITAELLAIVRRVHERRMHPTLMTNGIQLTRSMLVDLVKAGLTDIAFHVDTTQQRHGYPSETALNQIRRRYIDMSRGLPLIVYFNTTVYKDNFHEIPALVRFFRRQADTVRIAAFQLQADTGRGILGKRDAAITQQAVLEQIETGAGTTVNFSNLIIGNPRCNRCGICLAVNGNLYDVLDDPRLVKRIHAATPHIAWLRNRPRKSVGLFLGWLVRHPFYLLSVGRWGLRKLWSLKKDLLGAGGRIHALAFLVHGFMDADALDCDRVQSCAFKTMTATGPVCMCVHNANRKEYILNSTKCAGAGFVHRQPLAANCRDNP
jgi:pyruvate-formate lyase-activating enzyme